MIIGFKGVSSDQNDELIKKHVRQFVSKKRTCDTDDIPIVQQETANPLDKAQIMNVYGNIKRIVCCMNDKGGNDRHEAGQKFEQLLEERLKENKINFENEQQQKQRMLMQQKNLQGPTPDFLLKTPIRINNTDVHWIECKNYYGTTIPKLVNRLGFIRAALKYKAAFGPGLMIFGFGFNKDLPKIDGVLYADAREKHESRDAVADDVVSAERDENTLQCARCENDVVVEDCIANVGEIFNGRFYCFQCLTELQLEGQRKNRTPVEAVKHALANTDNDDE